MGRKITVLVTQIFITAFLMKAKKLGKIYHNGHKQNKLMTSMQSLKRRIKRTQIQMNIHSMILFI